MDNMRMAALTGTKDYFTFHQLKYATSPKYRCPQLNQSSRQNSKTPWFPFLVTLQTSPQTVLPKPMREAQVLK
ncbi:hypothetical protein OIU79_029219 [Salix purpurea]|uniref:Uncharacterized protein n=1 Tax=Salix purpurea TaxID=77065 RepID=A0A9Q0VI82_SALPP|nr:hypothetical protein OIU79_029219 [Salix purpurea]